MPTECLIQNNFRVTAVSRGADMHALMRQEVFDPVSWTFVSMKKMACGSRAVDVTRAAGR